LGKIQLDSQDAIKFQYPFYLILEDYIKFMAKLFQLKTNVKLIMIKNIYNSFNKQMGIKILEIIFGSLTKEMPLASLILLIIK
jgi:hypothetical protein